MITFDDFRDLVSDLENLGAEAGGTQITATGTMLRAQVNSDVLGEAAQQHNVEIAHHMTTATGAHYSVEIPSGVTLWAALRWHEMTPAQISVATERKSNRTRNGG